MNTTYLVAFALAAVPYAAYLMGMLLMGLSAQRAAAPNRDRRVVIWLVVFTVLAFVLAGWQQIRLNIMFDWPSNLDIESRRVLGVDIPLALGNGAHDLVSSLFWALVQLTLIGVWVVSLLRPPPDSSVPRWVAVLILAALIGLFMWTASTDLATVLEEWRKLF